MIESQDRVAEFKSEIADLRLADPALARDRLLLRLGVALLTIGPLWTVVAYFISHQTKNPLQPKYGGGSFDAFVAKISSGATPLAAASTAVMSEGTSQNWPAAVDRYFASEQSIVASALSTSDTSGGWVKRKR